MGRSSSGQRELGLLFMRIGIGLIFVLFGQPILFGGVEVWENIGRSMSYLKIDYLHALWGFLAGVSAFAGGICLILGFLFRPSLVLLLLTTVVISIMYVSTNAGFEKISYPVAMGVVFLSLIFTGPGKYSVSRI